MDNSPIKYFLSGASSINGYNDNEKQSSGGFVSIVESSINDWNRVNPIPGLRILKISACKVGIGQISAIDGNKLSYMGPDSTAAGSPVDVPVGVPTYISDNNNNYVQVLKPIDNPLFGNEKLQIIKRFNNIIGGPDVDVTDSTSSIVDYISFVIQPNGISHLYIDTTSPNIELSAEELTTGQLTETPASLTYTTDVYIETVVNPIGVWIKRATPPTASPQIENKLVVQFTHESVQIEHEICGFYRVFDANLSGLLTYHNDILIGSDVELPYIVEPSSGENVYELKRRNKYGLISGSIKKTVYIDDVGEQEDNPPSVPTGSAIATVNGNKIRLTSLYSSIGDDFPAKSWEINIYPTDETAGTPVNIDFLHTGQIHYLDYTTTAEYIDNTPITAEIRVKNYTKYSELITVTGTVGSVPPLTASKHLFHGGLSLFTPSVQPPTETTIIDPVNNVRFVDIPGRSSFYVADVLIWKIVSNAAGNYVYVPSDYTINLATIINNASITGGLVDYIDDKLYINVNKTCRLEIDPVNKTIKHNGRSFIATPVNISAPRPIWGRYSETIFSVWSVTNQQWISAFELNNIGKINTRGFTWNTKFNQSTIEGL